MTTRNDPFVVVLLPLPPWARMLAVTVSVGPVPDFVSSLWAVVQQLIGGQWVDVGGIIASGKGVTSGATTYHPVTPTTAFRIASNMAIPTYTTAAG